MPDVEGGDLEAELQGRDPYYQVLERDGYPLGTLLSFDTSDKPGHLDGKGMQRDIAAQAINECQTTLPLGIRLRAIYAMDQFGDGHDRESDFYLAVSGL